MVYYIFQCYAGKWFITPPCVAVRADAESAASVDHLESILSSSFQKTPLLSIIMPKGMLLLAPHSDDASVDASVDAGGGGGTDSATGATGATDATGAEGAENAARRRGDGSGGGFKFDAEVLKDNEQRLFSSYDIYATLEHLMREDHGGGGDSAGAGADNTGDSAGAGADNTGEGAQKGGDHGSNRDSDKGDSDSNEGDPWVHKGNKGDPWVPWIGSITNIGYMSPSSSFPNEGDPWVPWNTDWPPGVPFPPATAIVGTSRDGDKVIGYMSPSSSIVGTSRDGEKVTTNITKEEQQEQQQEEEEEEEEQYTPSSFFLPTLPNRTCAQAGIPPEHCGCLPWGQGKWFIIGGHPSRALRVPSVGTR